ncbi:hypothetical protein CS542_09440 [Pedobacter sp. IW39]|nr:hypothetical protein CS542_09440 [Pedobacter sp. IW39]
MFTKNCSLKANAQKLNKFILYIIGIRTALFLYSLLMTSPYSISSWNLFPRRPFYTGIYILQTRL